MQARIEKELELLLKHFPKLEYIKEGNWFRIPSYSMPPGWSLAVSDVVFQVLVGYPGTPPYGFYVPAGLTFNGQRPGNYTEPSATKPPFEGTWGVFSWAPADGHWRATGDLSTGGNLLNWVLGFTNRLKEGA
jgi:hypothetical protein